MRTWGTRRGGWWLLVAVAVGVSSVSWLSHLLPGVVGGALVAVAATVGAALSQRGQQLIDQDASRTASSGDALLRDRGGRIPKVRDIEDLIEIGVHPTAPERDRDSPTVGARAPAFVRRARSPEIEAALRTHSFVLLVGESTAGKSRAAFEAVRAVLPEAAFIAPDPAHPSALQAATTAVQSERRSVVWLDDVERYLGAGGLTPYLLRRLTHPGGSRTTVVVATIRAQERARHLDVQQAGDGPGRRTVRDVLLSAHEIRLDRRWHEDEVARAREQGHQDSRLARAVESAGRYGIAEFLAAGPQLLAAWQDAWAPEGGHTRGAALVSAAVEARRAGWSRPLPGALLRDLHEQHLTARGGPSLRPESWDEALSWATTPLYATSSMLLPHDSPDSYYVFDYLSDSVDAGLGDSPIPDGTWTRLIAAAEPDVCEDIGWTAVAHTKRAVARDAFQRALGDGVLTAAVGLALLMGDEWHLEEACQVLRTTLASAPADTAAEVRFALRSSLAWWTGGAGNTEEALALVTAQYEERRDRYGEDQAETLDRALSVARWTGNSGRTTDALDLALATRERALAALGPDHPMTIHAGFEVAVWTGANGRTTEAVSLWRALAADARRVLGTHDRTTNFVDWNLAGTVTESGDTSQGLNLLANVVRDRSVIFGGDHPWTFAGRLQFAGLTGETGQLEEARTLLNAVVEDAERALGHDHELTLAGRHQHALWTARSGQPGEAADQFRILLADCEHNLGPDHPLTQDCRARVADPSRPPWYYEPPSW
ncbi:tetratricopeptide repeat protein [Streptomyces sp. NPDC051243]|uniref:tetratricopeptide repeat protein n=1 Tax=Streptomyces sp. NPDC051243 TaxID=3365646 RepID=UPI00379773EC